MNIIIKKVIFKKDNFAVVKDENNNIFQFKNLLHKIEELVDIPLKIEVKEIFHKKYGKQYKILNYSIIETSLSFFLRKIAKTGLPKEAIYKLDKQYDLNSFSEILKNNPTLLLKEKHIGKKRLQEIINKFEENKELLELTNLLSSANISSSFLNEIYKFLKQKDLSIKDLEKNPYILTKIDGIGFKKADKIALNLGIEENSLLRISAFIIYFVEQEIFKNGNTLILKNKIEDAINENLNLSENNNLLDNALLELEKEEEIKKINYNDSIYYIKNNYKHMEEYIIELINNYDKMRFWKNNLSKAELFQYIHSGKYKLSSKQKKAVETFAITDAPFFILAGYAGSGKTTTAKKIMNIYADLYGKENIVACALSGNASNRIKNVTGYNAYTIHSLLGYKGHKFKFDENNPLPYKLVVLDEASMVDIYLFYSLLKAIDFTKTKLFIIGDNAQLPPVGAGEVFSDILEIEHIEKVVLDKVFRQNENQVINIFAQDIRKGKIPKGYKKEYEDYKFTIVEIDNYFETTKNISEKEKKELRNNVNNEIKKSILQLAKYINENGLSLLKDRAFESYNNNDFENFKKYISKYIYYFQVIAPQKNGILGTIELNYQLKNIFNNIIENLLDFEKEVDDKKISIQDKVIHLKNKDKSIFTLEQYKNIKKEIIEKQNDENNIEFLNVILNKELDDLSIQRVFNGQVGIVVDELKFKDNDEEYEYIVVYYPDNDYITIYNEYEIKNKIIDLANSAETIAF